MASSSVILEKRPLFGGAIELQLPKGFLDVSDFRQVPDTQEVFTTEDGDVSVVVEVLDVVKDEGSENDLWKAVNFHFGAISHDNEAIEQQVTTSGPSTAVPPTKLGSYLSVDDLSTKFSTPNPITLEGTQSVRKFRSERPADELPPPDKVTIFVALWRVLLDNGTEDGRPIPADEDDVMEARSEIPRRGRYSDILMSVNVNTTNINQRDLEGVRNWFNESTEKMRVEDYSLFVESVIEDA